MMRLPKFRYLSPTSLAEAAKILAGEGPTAKLLAGGTDLLPNMKRRHERPATLIALSKVSELRSIGHGDGYLVLGAGLTLAALTGHRAIRERHGALFRAAGQVATPPIRTQATLGGNLCLDTRCTYYDQSYEWRQAIDFCMKAPKKSDGAYTAGEFVGGLSSDQHDGNEAGSICWVAPGSPRCWATSSTDTAPALIALGAEVELESATGRRRISLPELYHDDGMAFLTKRPDEILARVLIPDLAGWTSTYWKLRRRGSFDFPVLGVGVAVRRDGDIVTDARIAIGGITSAPLVAANAASVLVGHRLDDETIAAAAEAATTISKPMDNTDFQVRWRRQMVKSFVTGALRELRGDDPAALGVLARAARRELALPVLS